MSQQELEFQTYHGSTQSRSKPHPHQHILNQCMKIEKTLVQSQIQKVITKLFNIWKVDFDPNKDQDFIISIHLKESQLNELSKFTQMIEHKLLKFAHDELLMDYEDIHIQLLKESDVRNIVLDIYVYSEMHPDIKVKIFLCEKVTNLNEHNISYFRKGCKGKGFLIIIPTYSTFDSQAANKTEDNVTKLHIKLLEPKQLFQEIKSYLPEQILSLITDMDYYAISFKQNCRRFKYCLQRSLTLIKQEHKWVDFYGLVSLIEDMIKHKFKRYQGYQTNIQKLIKVILSEKETYNIPSKAISYQLAFQKSIDQDIFLTSIQRSLIKYLNERQQYKLYANFFIQENIQAKPLKKNKKTREQLLGVDGKKNLSLKNRLDEQITKVIKHATQSIRQQAMRVKWTDIKYDLRIKPPIPLLIHKIVSEDDETIQLYDQITSTAIAPLAHYLPKFEDIGQAIYLLKRLQLQGLIEISKKSIRPLVYSTFFQKAKFSGKY